jgi:replicative DNA helicase
LQTDYNSQNIEFLILLLKDKFYKKKIIQVLQNEVARLLQPNADFYETFQKIETLRQEIEINAQSSGTMLNDCLNLAVKEMYERIETRKKGNSVFETGYKGIDNLLNIEKGNFIILGARPSVGKTSLANNLALNVARNNTKVLYVSLEVTKLSLTNRILFSEVPESVNNKAFYKGYTTPEECLAIEDTLPKFSIVDTETGEFKELQIKIVDRVDSIQDIEKVIITEIRQFGYEFIIIDYLQMIGGAKGNNANEQTTLISRTLKTIAKKMHVPILALSQLSREIEKRGNPRPLLSDLRDSGSLEQDADIIIFLDSQITKDKRNGLETSEADNYIDIIISKNRNGEIGDVKLSHNKTRTKFYDTEVNDFDFNFNNQIQPNNEKVGEFPF